MLHYDLRLGLSALVLALAAPAINMAQDRQKIADKGFGFLETYCIRCHGVDFKFPGLDMNERSLLLEGRSESYDAAFLSAGEIDDSAIWRVVEDGYMPPEKQAQPSEEEKAALKAWIEAGAPFPRKSRRPDRRFVGERTLLSIIARDLRQHSGERRKYLRYFSLQHLWGHQDLSDGQLSVVRAGVSKLINSLSSKPRITVPTEVDDDGLILRIDLRDYGWTHRRHWLPLLRQYPYGLQVAGDAAQQVYQLSESDLPYLRADWFVYAASRPPLYHQLVTLPDFVGIPEKLGVLERLLSVDPQANFAHDRVWRAGFTGEKSGVSDHNRIVERHESRYGYFWPSYDSAGDSGRQDFFNFPMGPKFAGSPNVKAFEHDGGEIIFSLPNRLQAYMLVTGDGERIDSGPQQIVRDPNEFSGAFDIVNGISCMGCHKHGMLPFTDTIRQHWEGRAGQVADKVRRIYPVKSEMDTFLSQDRQSFAGALTEAIKPFISTAEGPTSVMEFPEPITATSKVYGRVLDLADVARELGVPQQRADANEAQIKVVSHELTTAIRLNARLRRYGLGPLAHGEAITREQWEAVATRTARELGLGIVLSVE